MVGDTGWIDTSEERRAQNIAAPRQLLSQRQKVDLAELGSIRFELFPTNTTSQTQPLDGGIISWVKAMYLRRLLFRVFDNIDAERKSMYNVDIFTAIRWTVEDWERCPSDVIMNFFSHFLKKDGCSDTHVEAEVEKDALQSIQMDGVKHGAVFTKDGLRHLLNPLEENNVVEELDFSDLVREVAEIVEYSLQ